MNAAAALLWLAAVVAAVSTVGGAAWWLLAPRVRDLIAEVAGVRTELTDDSPGSVSRHARVAASAAAELPVIREQLSALAESQADVDRWRTDVDGRLHGLTARLGGVEQVMVALAGPELRRRLFEDIADEGSTTR